MRKYLLLGVVASLAVSAASAYAQSFTTGSINGVPFHAFTTTGPTGFGAGFAQGLAASGGGNGGGLISRLMQNPLYDRCVASQADAILSQKKLPPAEVVHARMDAIRAYCGQAFRKF